MASNTTPVSEDQYFYKLDNMILSSCQHVRKIFKLRWKAEAGDEWVDDQDHRRRFIEYLGDAANKLKQLQKEHVETKNVEDWDMTQLFAMITIFGSKDKYETENSLIKALKDLRNELAHHSNKKISQEIFNKSADIFRSSLLSLGMTEDAISKLIDRAGVTSSVLALKFMKELHATAAKCFKDGNHDEEMKLLSEAIEVPSLLPTTIGSAYEKRAECFLRLAKNNSLNAEENCKLAQEDVDKALEMNDASWMVHFLAAQCQRWKRDLPRALHHYEKALILSPVQTQVKDDFHSCKILAGLYNRSDHPASSSIMPTGELVSEVTKIKGQDHVSRGHQHYFGQNVPQNFTEAVKHFAKAASLKNAEGMYNLARCNHLGQGVKQDVREALRLYLEVAKMDKDMPGVAHSQFAVGLMFESGTGVKVDFVRAAMWYKEAFENGAGDAANNLAILYAEGKGVQKNEKMAEIYWKKAVILKESTATSSLVGYYLNQMEPDKALETVRIGKEMGNQGLISLQDEELNRTISELREVRLGLEPEIVKFENANQLKAKGLTFKQRVARKGRYLDPNRDTSWHKTTEMMTLETIVAVEEKALEGSEEAAKILKTLSIAYELKELLEQDMEKLEKQKFAIAKLLFKCATMEFHLVKFNDSSKQKLKSIIANLFEEKCGTKKKGDEDMIIRFCFVIFNLSRSLTSDDMYAVDLLKEGIRRYPDNVDYYEQLTYLLSFKQKWEEGRICAEEGLKSFPNNLRLLYFRAVHLRQESPSAEKLDRLVWKYKKFLIAAPIDHKNVPEAYYQISSLYLNEGTDMESVKVYFKLGQEAEGNQLACHLPYEKSEAKSSVEAALEPTRETSAMATQANGNDDDKESVLERKKYLKSPIRKALIVQHRKEVKATGKGQPKPVAPKLTQEPATKMSLVKPIILSEMNSTEDDYIFEDRIIDLMIMDEPNGNNGSVIYLICEDAKGDVIRVQIYNVMRGKETLKMFGPGGRIAIINPYVIKGDQSEIRVDEPKCLLYLEGEESMCRFCGKEEATQKCSKCKRPYCSKECQTLDWKEFSHKLICSS